MESDVIPAHNGAKGWISLWAEAGSRWAWAEGAGVNHYQDIAGLVSAQRVNCFCGGGDLLAVPPSQLVAYGNLITT